MVDFVLADQFVAVEQLAVACQFERLDIGIGPASQVLAT